jgi:hypothetical protein
VPPNAGSSSATLRYCGHRPDVDVARTEVAGQDHERRLRGGTPLLRPRDSRQRPHARGRPPGGGRPARGSPKGASRTAWGNGGMGGNQGGVAPRPRIGTEPAVGDAACVFTADWHSLVRSARAGRDAASTRPAARRRGAPEGAGLEPAGGSDTLRAAAGAARQQPDGGAAAPRGCVEAARRNARTRGGSSLAGAHWRRRCR